MGDTSPFWTQVPKAVNRMPVGNIRNRAIHLCILFIDIERFSRDEWDDQLRAQLRSDLDALVRPALATVALGRWGHHHWNTGDGRLDLLDPQHRGDVVDAVAALDERLRELNEGRVEGEKLRLRVVVHSGEVTFDDQGNAVGDAINFTRRLLDSERLHTWLTATRHDLVLMVSEQIYSQVIKQGHCQRYDRTHFQWVTVRHRQVRVTAWVFPRDPRPLGVGHALAAGWERGWEAGRRIGEPVVRLLQRRVWRVPLWVLALLLALVIGVIVVAIILLNRDEADACPVPTELPVLTSPTSEGIVRQLGDMFTDGLKGPGGRCRKANVTVFSIASSSEAVKAVGAGWPSDYVTGFGPEPSVLIPDSQEEVNRINQRLAGARLTTLGSVATSPVVLAVRRSDRERAGLGRSSTWNEIRRAGQPAGNPTVRIARSDPTSTATALLGTAGLYSTSDDASDRREIEQTLTPVVGDSETAALCPQGHDKPLVGGGPPTAVIISEQLIVARNRGKLGGSCAGKPLAGSDPLEAIYPSDRTPFLDYPYVLLKAASKDGRKEIALKFFQFLESDVEARKVLCEAGFRNANRQVCGTISEQDGVLAVAPVTPVPAPDGKDVQDRLDQWAAARRAVWALLVLDVSGSMRNQLPDQPGADRMAAAQEAARNAVQLMGSRDHIGLWKFSTRLEGDRDYQELVPLGPVDTQRQAVLDALAGMRAPSGDTGLYDTIIAGVAHLQDKGGQDNGANALIVVTDGENDDPAGGATIGDVIDQLPDESQMHVFLLVFGPAACGSPSLTKLTNRTDAVCLDAGEIGLERAFKQVSATLWGTE